MNISFGFVYGLACSGSMFLGEPAETSMSNALIAATNSINIQLTFTLKSNGEHSGYPFFYLGDG